MRHVYAEATVVDVKRRRLLCLLRKYRLNILQVASEVTGPPDAIGNV